MQTELFQLPEIDRKKTQAAVEAAFDKYRVYKRITFEEREAAITAAYTERFHGPTGTTSDQTADIAVYNVDTPEQRRAYCVKIEGIVQRLFSVERQLIEARYMGDPDVKDYQVYSLMMGISWGTYAKHRQKAFYHIALFLNIATYKGR